MTLARQGFPANALPKISAHGARLALTAFLGKSSKIARTVSGRDGRFYGIMGRDEHEFPMPVAAAKGQGDGLDCVRLSRKKCERLPGDQGKSRQIKGDPFHNFQKFRCAGRAGCDARFFNAMPGLGGKDKVGGSMPG